MTNSLFLLFFISSLLYSAAGWLLIPKLRFCRRSSGRESPPASLSIIIPARNERERLPILLKSLKDEKAFDRGEVIVADDGSEDGTGRIAAEAGCRVVRIAEKPMQAQGKSWACAVAAEGAKGTHLLFLDADVRFVAGGLDAVLGSFTGGLLSVQPYHRFYRPYESLSAYFNLMAMAGVNSFSLRADTKPVRGAFGPCLLCRREDYRRTGGHGAIRESLVDDMAMARLFRDQGLPVHNFAGKNTVEYRMYPEGFKSLLEGWTKNIAAAASISAKTAGLYFAVWCAGAATLFGALLTAAGWRERLLGFAAYALYTFQFRRIVGHIGSWKLGHALFFPLYLLFFLTILIRSAVNTRVYGFARWKGRKIMLKKKG